jgi:hypothetical protein
MVQSARFGAALMIVKESLKKFSIILIGSAVVDNTAHVTAPLVGAKSFRPFILSINVLLFIPLTMLWKLYFLLQDLRRFDFLS